MLHVASLKPERQNITNYITDTTTTTQTHTIKKPSKETKNNKNKTKQEQKRINPYHKSKAKNQTNKLLKIILIQCSVKKP